MKQKTSKKRPQLLHNGLPQLTVNRSDVKNDWLVSDLHHEITKTFPIVLKCLKISLITIEFL